MYLFYLHSKFTEHCPQGLKWKQVTSSVNVVSAYKRQHINWINDDQGLWCHMGSLGHKELKRGYMFTMNQFYVLSFTTQIVWFTTQIMSYNVCVIGKFYTAKWCLIYTCINIIKVSYKGGLSKSRNFRDIDKAVTKPSYDHNGISYAGKNAARYWNGVLVAIAILCRVLCAICRSTLVSVNGLWASTVLSYTDDYDLYYSMIVRHSDYPNAPTNMERLP